MKQRLINYLLRGLLHSIDIHDIIEVNKGMLCIGGKVATNQEVRNLISEVKALEQFRIWKIMNETVRSKAMDVGFNKSVTFDDLKTCKLMLYNLDILNSICTIIKSKEK